MYNEAVMHKSINTTGYDFEWEKAANIVPKYEWFFSPLVGKGIRLLELGVQGGVSLLFWRDYLENATVVGLDCSPVHIDDPTGMIHVYQGYQQDTELLDRIVKEQAPDGFDIVIDDCSHIGKLARTSFWHLFYNHLKPGGLYAIEDWGTGYMNTDIGGKPNIDGRCYKPKSKLAYPRNERILQGFGRGLSRGLSRVFPCFPRLTMIPYRFFYRSTIPSHMHGMVGFVKELLDACCLGERAVHPSSSGRYLDYGIDQVHINRNIVIVMKATEVRRS